MKYSHILHYEKLVDEWPIFLKNIGINSYAELPWENKGPGLIQSYLNRITEEEEAKLFSIYKEDFVNFNYSVNDPFKSF